MSFRFSCGVVTAAVAFGLCCGAGQSRAGDSPQIPASDDSAGKKTSTSAVEQLESSRPARANLLSRIPHKPETIESLLGDQGSLTPPQAMGPGRRSRDLLPRDDDWTFITPEDVIREYVMREILKMPRYGRDNSDLGRRSAVERYYERLPRGGAEKPEFEFDLFELFGGGKLLKDQDRQARQEGQDESPASSKLLAAFGQRPPLMNDYVERPFFGADLNRPDVPWGLADSSAVKEPTPEAIRDRKILQEQLTAMRKIWEFQQDPPPAAPWNLSGQLPAPGLVGGGVAPTPVFVGSSPFAAATASPIVRFGAAPAAPTLALPAYSPQAPLAPGQLDASQVEPVANSTRPPPPKVEFSVPQRRF